MANIREGARRIRAVGNVIMLLALTAGMLLWLIGGPLFIVALPYLPLGALVWAAGWILEGFAE